ncbi:PTS mannitol transporter subunit IICB [[Mycoplasma] collis]|uniref:PTS mannitol transporter subunit IICB n=1 Tax=[Mycoplasma] collis TaxID=2127 RepID=UPI00051AC71B|nr:PTS mannitol transporter subunit IICB [[Mycoplasma] collis]
MKSIKVIKTKIQNLGSLLSSSILPIIGVFIAWGILTTFFIPTGWTPNKLLEKMVEVGIVYIIPTLIGFLLGKKIYDLRGGAIASIVSLATISAGQTEIFKSIVGDTAAMFLGVMIFSPIAALILKYSERLWINKIKSGFEMLINNFYLGILGFILIFPTFYLSIYAVGYLQFGLAKMIEQMQKYKLYPILAIIIEPAKVLFLNNAINHGIFTPLGTQQVLSSGKSILFLLESNPGPGLGILIAWMIFGFKKNKSLFSQSASSSVVHLFGGIHEVYFPFILLKPILILATISGGIVGNLVFQIFNVGAVAPISPGSIIAGFIQINKSWNDILGYSLGIIASAAVSSLVAIFILIYSSKKDKNKIKNLNSLKNSNSNIITNFNTKEIIFACDAGMGSSAMGASILRKILNDLNINDIQVKNKAINNLNENDKFIITIEQLSDRVKKQNPKANVIVIKQFLDKLKYQEIAKKIKNEKK